MPPLFDGAFLVTLMSRKDCQAAGRVQALTESNLDQQASPIGLAVLSINIIKILDWDCNAVMPTDVKLRSHKAPNHTPHAHDHPHPHKPTRITANKCPKTPPD